MTRGCEALTARGVRCRDPITFRVDLGAAGVRQLCAYHRRMSQHRPMAMWDRPADPTDWEPERTPKRPWTAEDDALLLDHEGESAPTVAALLNRTPMAVWQRRSRLRRDKVRARRPVASVDTGPHD